MAEAKARQGLKLNQFGACITYIGPHNAHANFVGSITIYVLQFLS